MVVALVVGLDTFQLQQIGEPLFDYDAKINEVRERVRNRKDELLERKEEMIKPEREAPEN